MIKKSQSFIFLFGLLSILLGFCFYFLHPGPQKAWQGWVEGDFLFIGPDEPGRLVVLDVKEGQKVLKDQHLFRVQTDVQDAELQQALAAVEEANARLDRSEAKQQRPEEIEVLQAQATRARAAIEQSKPELERAKELVAKGYAPESRLDSARAAYNRDLAALDEIEHMIHVAELKSRSEDIEAARAAVSQAQSRLAAAQTRRQQRDVSAPASGTIQEVYYREGEVVPAGRPVVSLLPPKNVKVRFFVPQHQLPNIKIGLPLLISCDGCGQDLIADVIFLSTEAEFTPPVIFSLEERDKLVYRIEARPRQVEALRVGQPVTVTLLSASEKISSNGQ